MSEMNVGAVSASHGTFASTDRSLIVVNASLLNKLISMKEAVEIIETATRSLAASKAAIPQRWGMPVGNGGLMVLMPGAIPAVERFGLKALSLFDSEARRGRSGHQGLMILFDARTGRPMLAADAAALTGLRTAAATAVATRALARQDATTVALLGCGEQAACHARALPLVRDIREVRVWGRDMARAEAFAAKWLTGFERVHVSPSPREAINGADIICTLTHSNTPILSGAWLEPGQHVNLVGASTMHAREIDNVAVTRGKFVVDLREHALSDAGELLQAIADGLVDESHIHAEIGDVLCGDKGGRQNDVEITIYKSLGHIAQDIAVADAIERRLSKEGSAYRIAW
jgi:ornithine cyclodeaminase/alanine dehydrogenase-like protein (mu-crystallin family)